jgi:DNA-binding MarR family transcriptional regulator
MGFYSDSDFIPDVSIGWLCKRVSQLSTAGLEPVFAREGLTNVQWHALISIYFGRAATSAALARDLAYDKGATTRLIDQMEARGWVTRHREHDDRRLIALKLTAEGEAVAHRVRQLIIATWNGWLADWDDADAAQAVAVLQRLRSTLENVT